ncbi:hypothetical protein GGX14DRAFT_399740 [Mycena pura]|uniref:Uncharacterized protein n=1 Tax=Mycena pura TaxID=153505 RepID=A0AAD6V3D8_9AGAR|nr:hypothetical protein GGX14DRAFT_399740 [Mycena pura]
MALLGSLSESTGAPPLTAVGKHQLQGTAEATNEDPVLYSDEYYAAQKAKRQGLGLIKFIGGLFKLEMLTERIMHDFLDTSTPKARAHLDVYFSRMNKLCKSNSVGSRMQFMLQMLSSFVSTNGPLGLPPQLRRHMKLSFSPISLEQNQACFWENFCTRNP